MKKVRGQITVWSHIYVDYKKSKLMDADGWLPDAERSEDAAVKWVKGGHKVHVYSCKFWECNIQYWMLLGE